MSEQWRDVVGCRGYVVSSIGRVGCMLPRPYRAAPPLTPRIISLFPDKDGYLCASIYRDRKQYKRAVHTLLLEAFVGPRPDGMEACHGNGVRTDNRLENLRWDTPVANAQDRIKHGTYLRGEDHWKTKLTDAQVDEALASTENSATIARRVGVAPSTIRRARSGKTWAHKSQEAA